MLLFDRYAFDPAEPIRRKLRCRQSREEFDMNYEAAKKSYEKTAKPAQDEAIDRAMEAIETVQRETAAVSKVVQQSAADVASEISKKLKEAGVDTDQLIITAREQASSLHQRVADEVRDRPLRALGFAALAGLAFGLLSTR